MDHARVGIDGLKTPLFDTKTKEINLGSRRPAMINFIQKTQTNMDVK